MATTAGAEITAQEVEALRARLADTEETLRAIRNGEVDALVSGIRSVQKMFGTS